MRKSDELFERKVLIVDDEEINREILGNIIESEYKVAFAKDRTF
ncbi:MAG: response regulator [Treponema sp.]|nr:response regulator [Treponema sp.]